MRKLLVFILSVALLLGCVPFASAYYNTSEWAVDTVKSMYELGFLPDELAGNKDMTSRITRGEMCKMAVLVFEHLMGGKAYPDSTNNFEDTNDPAISFAYEQGIVSGYGNGKFGPNDPLTRQDFFKITHNLMGTAYCDTSNLNLVSLDSYTDSYLISEYAVLPTRVMVTIGVVQGFEGRLTPKNYTSCEEAIAMFFRAYQYMCQWFMEQTEANKQVAIENQGYSGIANWAISSVMTMKEKRMIPSSLDNCNMTHAITREQMCEIAVLAYTAATGKSCTAERTDHFTDTNSPAINAAYELGIINGYGDGLFGPKDLLTREQFFKIMANFMKVIGYPRTDSRAVSLAKFGDGKQVADWAQAPTRLLIYIGAVMGDGKNLNPQNNTTIQEALTVFLRCYNFTNNWRLEHPDGETYEEPTIYDDLLAFAKSFLGYPYVYGGNGPNYFDCSGFVLYVYKHFGYSFSRGAQEQYRDGTPVNYNELMPGDLVFFSSNGYCITHVGLYIGDGEFIHASNPTRGVVIDTLWSGYYKTHYWSACRIITE